MSITSPLLYQLNTNIYLAELSAQLGRAATLRDMPERELDQLAHRGFDWLYLLGAWEIGAAGRQVSATHAAIRAGFQTCLPDVADADICGSPFAVVGYQVRERFGGNAGLEHLRQRLAKRGIRIMLDFVPNHTALDHPLVATHPEYFIQGTADELAAAPHNFLEFETAAGRQILAHGRDPYFPGWPDTLQLDYRKPTVRQYVANELLQVAAHCDGVRCDMAMLLLNDVFARTWPSSVDGSASAAAEDFWPSAIRAVRQRHSDFVLMAEVYWGLDGELQRLGFDYTYDKHLYDMLHERNPHRVREHLRAGVDYQQHCARFLENHDEARAAAAFGDKAVVKAAAVITYFAPGLRFFHEGQFEGRHCHASVHLCRRIMETCDAELHAFYEQLLHALKEPDARGGQWQLLDCIAAWDGNPTHHNFIAYRRSLEPDKWLLIAVNYSRDQGQCFVQLPDVLPASGQVRLTDLMSDAQYVRDANELRERGLYVDEPPWKFYVFRCEPLQ